MASIAVVAELEAYFEWAERFDCNLGIVAVFGTHLRLGHYIVVYVAGASVVGNFVAVVAAADILAVDILVEDFVGIPVADILVEDFVVAVVPSILLISDLQLRPLQRSSCEALLVY